MFDSDKDIEHGHAMKNTPLLLLLLLLLEKIVASCVFKVVEMK